MREPYNERQKSRGKREVIPSLILIALLAFTGCTREKITWAEIAPARIITHEHFEDIDSIVIDKGNRVYVSDVQSIKVFDPEGELLTEIGKPGTGDGGFTGEVIGLAINSHDELYVVDRAQPRIEVFTLEGTYLRGFGRKGMGEGEFLDPQGILIDQLDLVYVSDKVRNDIQVFSRYGDFLYRIGKSGNGYSELNEPESMAINDDRLYVADEGNSRVQIFSLRGKHLGNLPHSGAFATARKIETGMDDIPHNTDVDKYYKRCFEGDLEGIAFDNRGLFYVLDEDAGAVLVFHDEIQVGCFTSTTPIISGDGLSFGPDFQRVFVVDQGNSRILVFEMTDVLQALGLE